MERQELIAKLAQIEEHARLTLEEFPKNLTRERQRMIIALARYIRTELSMTPVRGALPQSSNEDQQPFAPEPRST
jgi:hypothetical protein